MIKEIKIETSRFEIITSLKGLEKRMDCIVNQLHQRAIDLGDKEMLGYAESLFLCWSELTIKLHQKKKGKDE